MQVRTRVKEAEIIVADNDGKVAFKYSVKDVDVHIDAKRLVEIGDELVKQILALK